MAIFIANVHFLRPWWLAALAPACILIALALRRQDRGRLFRNVIADHLLKHLLVDSDGTRNRQPVMLLAAFWLCAVIAAAGPTWEKEPSPFIKDTAGMVVVIKVTPSMLARDIQPSRLERATQKIHDLMELRSGARTALIAYSGTPHLVMPFTTDSDIIDMFARALTPDIMPDEGDSLAAALELADRQITGTDMPGSILVIADQVTESQMDVLQNRRNGTTAAKELLAMAAPEGVVVPPDSPPAPALDRAAMEKAAAAMNAGLTIATPDDSDIRTLNARMTRSLESAVEEEGDRWRDAGYFLLPLLLLLGLLSFRRGMQVTYE